MVTGKFFKVSNCSYYTYPLLQKKKGLKKKKVCLVMNEA